MGIDEVGQDLRTVDYRFGDCSLDTETLELTRSGAIVSLEPQVLRLILVLIENRDRAVAKDELIEKVWKRRFVSDSSLNTCISAARQALGDDGRSQSVIKTLPRLGFRFVAEVEESGAPLGRLTLRTGEPSIAVLPFENLSGDPEQEYFADGLCEDLITDLSNIAGLLVVARNSSFALKGRSADVKKISESLGVSHVLEGSARKVGPKIRVNVQLIDAASGGYIWAERYDGDIGDIFEFQDNIRDRIVSALEVKLTAADRATADRKPTSSIDAYDLFLKGRASFYGFTSERLFEAKECFEQAIRIDPNYADAYGYLSYCHFYAWFESFPGHEDGLRRASELAAKGVAVDGSSAIATARLGWTQIYLRNFEEAVGNFKKAIALAPNNADIHADFAQAMNYWGNADQALELIARAHTLDAIAPPLWDAYEGHSLLLLGRFDQAVSKFRRAIERIPDFTAAHLRLAMAYTELRQHADAKATIRKIREISPRCCLRAVAEHYPYRIDAVQQHFLDCLREAGLPEHNG